MDDRREPVSRGNSASSPRLICGAAREATITERQIFEVQTAHPSRDGDGVAILRIAGMQHAGMDPVLMIDKLHSEHREDVAGGFPARLHRGMQLWGTGLDQPSDR